MKKNKSKTKALVSCIFAFLLTLLFTILYVCTGLSIGVFSNNSITTKLDESDYYNNVYNNLSKNTEIIVEKAGFPAAVLADAITLERVYVGGKNYIEQTLAGQEPKIKTDKLRKILSDNIDQYFTEQGIARTDKINTGIDKMISGIENEYKSSIQLKFVNYIQEYKVQFVNKMKITVPIIILLIGVLCFYLIRIHRYKHRGLRYINYALISSSCLTLFTAAYLILSKWYVKADVTPDYYRNFLEAYIKWDISVFLYLGGVGLLLSAALISLTGYLRNRINNN